jgi:opacity protein-like surface antigen
MKRVLLALLLAAGLSLAAALPATADPVGDEQPACGDVVLGDAFYHFESEPQNTVEGSIFLAEPSCKGVTYTFYVIYVSGGKEKVKSQTIHGDGESTLLFFLIPNVFPDTETVCVYFETAKGNNVIDRAPDEDAEPNCVTLARDSGPGGSSQFS